jgi:radical SAM superfamily enzyme YgiQ (UPF0313 family)
MSGKIGKIVLAIPNLRWHKTAATLWMVHPYNLCLLASMIRDRFEVVIVDANMEDLSRERFAARLAQIKPDLVGITVLTDEYGPAGHMAAAMAKQLDPEMPVVMGGVYALSAPTSIMADTNVDYVVIGEGEYVIGPLLDYLNGKGDLPSGVAYRREGRIVIPDRVPFIQDLDVLPLPSYDLVDYNRYSHTMGRYSVDNPRSLPYARMFTSRGCPIGCVFCQVETLAGRRFRPRSAGNVLAEMEWLQSSYGVTSVVFDDDNFFVNRKRVKAIFEGMIERKLNLKWNAIAVSVFLLDEELLELMKASGCQFIDLAIESGVKRILKQIIHKPVNLDKAKRLVAKCQELGIDVAANFVIGFPGETWEEIRQTLSFIESIPLDYAKIFIANPLPNTKLEKMAKEMGAIVEGVGVNWQYGRLQTDEFTPQDVAILRAYEWDRINFRTPERRAKVAAMMGISEAELADVRRETRLSLKFA